MVDRLGRPLAFILTGGQAHDAPILPALLGRTWPPVAIVADKAYDSRHVRQAIRDDDAPARRNATAPEPHDERLYRLRNVVERFFCRCKDMCRLATRFDKLACNFLAALHLFAARLWLSY